MSGNDLKIRLGYLLWIIGYGHELMTMFGVFNR